MENGVGIPGSTGSGVAIPVGPMQVADSGWITAAVDSPWKGTIEYRKQGNVVRLRGGLSAGGSGTVFTLPAGYRPPVEGYYWDVTVGGGGRSFVNITAAGVITVGGNEPAILNPVNFTTN
jgi:hypothetical protein